MQHFVILQRIVFNMVSKRCIILPALNLCDPNAHCLCITLWFLSPYFCLSKGTIFILLGKLHTPFLSRLLQQLPQISYSWLHARQSSQPCAFKSSDRDLPMSEFTNNEYLTTNIEEDFIDVWHSLGSLFGLSWGIMAIKIVLRAKWIWWYMF